jgi:HEAT repeat protein
MASPPEDRPTIVDDTEHDGTADTGAHEAQATAATDETTADYTPSYFAEREAVLAAADGIVAQLPAAFDSIVEDKSLLQQIAFVEGTLGKYQEFPELIKHHLEALITPFTGAVVARLPTAEKEGTDGSAAASAIATVDARLGQNYDDYDLDAPKGSLHTACRMLYVIAKVAGPKASTAYFPHDVRLVERVFYCLRRWQGSRHREWEVRYALLLWLSNLVLVPFALDVIDSTSDSSLGERLLQCAVDFLADPSKCSDAAALLIARLMTRPDSDGRRESFIDSSVIKLETRDFARGGGLLRALATTFKIGKRDELYDHALRLIPVAAKQALADPDAIVTKTAVKLMQRLGIALLPSAGGAWQYQKDRSDLEANLTGEAKPAADAKPKAATADGGVTELPGELEIVVDVLLQALSHKDTIVRYSAAKGIGRICERLPEDAAEDVLRAVFTNFTVLEKDGGWHGACLALAEAARRNVLLPRLFPDVLPYVKRALVYDVSKGSYSVGAHVRDSACYVCWSIARSYNTADLKHCFDQLAVTIATIAVSDREVNVRRAAAAAFQECVGRLGAYPDGIALIQLMDFFSLSSVGNAFSAVAPAVAEYATYRGPILEHMRTVKLVHWDRDIRRAAAKALGAIAIKCDAPVSDAGFEDLLVKATSATAVQRHGGVLGVASLVQTLPAETWSEGDLAKIAGLIPKIESARLFRGRGGEFVRQASCSLLLGAASNGLQLPRTVTVRTLAGEKKAPSVSKHVEFLEETWKQPLEWLQADAARAFGAYAKAYIGAFGEFEGKLLERLFTGLGENKAPNERRGCALVIGQLPKSVLCAPDLKPESEDASTVLDRCVAALATAAAVREGVPAEDQDAETRRNAVAALGAIAVRCAPELRPRTAGHIADTLAMSFEDYAIDKRGDVGSFVRLAAVSATGDWIVAMSKEEAKASATVASCRFEHLVRCVLKQLCEKIDKVRSTAGRTLLALSDAALVDEDARSFIRVMTEAGVADWGDPVDTFPLLRAAVAKPSLARAVVEGLLPSAGGKVMHVVKPALDVAAEAAGSAEHQVEFAKMLADVVAENCLNSRLTECAFTLADRLQERGALHTVALPALADAIERSLKHFAKDIKVVLPLVAPLASLCRAVDPAVRECARQRMLLLIASRFPAVRRLCGVEFYTALTMTGEDEAATAVVSTTWDSTDAAAVRRARDALYPMLELKKPEKAEAGDGPKVSKGPKQESYSSYGKLVKEMGY